MAATDKTYRNQKALDIVFAASCVLMLISIVVMFAADYFKGWKREQRIDRELQSIKAEREALQDLMAQKMEFVSAEGEKEVLALQEILEKVRAAEKRNNQKELQERKKQFTAFLGRFDDAEKEVADYRIYRDKIKKEHGSKYAELLSAKAKLDADYQEKKADYDSVESLYYIAIDDRDNAAAESLRETLQKKVNTLHKQLQDLKTKVADAKAKADENDQKIKALEESPVEVNGNGLQLSQKLAEKRLSEAEDRLKKLRGDYDRFHKLAVQKRWKLGDTIRNLPIIDGFRAPTRVEQISLPDLPIDYAFKHVTRYDRCTTCHLGIERTNFDKNAVRALTDVPSKLQDNVTTFRQLLKEYGDSRRKELEENKGSLNDGQKAELKQLKDGIVAGFKLEDLPETLRAVPETTLTPARVTEFCAHPRLELFVDSNSPHPVQKFGCTICHSGQGSATDFSLASHTPNTIKQMEEWKEEHSWESNHYWDFPMLPKRFVESGCVKCHHQMTDLIRYGIKNEAPKLLRGYNLVRDNGCFGCHEIAGLKSGRQIGPDLRLELSPPLEDYLPAEQAKLLADKANPPGTMRKVGPSLARITEKTNPEWVRDWIKSPRSFRPDTKMPHFYGLSNNDPSVLPDAQKDFPEAEIYAITYYLFEESKAYLKGEDRFRKFNLSRKKDLEEKEKTNLISDAEKKELAEVMLRLRLNKEPTPLVTEKDGKEQWHLVDAEGNSVSEEVLDKYLDTAKGQDAQIKEGRRLFMERGCLACHVHDGTRERMAGVPAVPAEDERSAYYETAEERHFGPNLSRIAAKIGPEPGKPGKAGRRWLVQWLMKPTVHSPRTKMPVTHLGVEEAAAIAAWLLRPNQDIGWAVSEQAEPELKTLKEMARVYLDRMTAKKDVEALLEGKDDDAGKRAMQWLKELRVDADEKLLTDGVTPDSLKMYLGKKAINRLGCFGCHNIPGFELAKPIGTPLNDWGKKDPHRLAFEDGKAFLETHFNLVAQRDGKDGKPADDWKVKTVKEGDKEVRKLPYEQFFADALKDHQREGFLHLKLADPRSYDYHRDRAWDDRLRMPQFRFSRKVPAADATPRDIALLEKEEAEAREAVMTFILGLVAEQIPAKYLNSPSSDRLAEVKGRHVLEKYNCGGCHQIRSGLYEVKPTPQALGKLDEAYTTYAEQRKDRDFPFKNHNAWVGQPYTDRLHIHGIPMSATQDQVQVWLTQALRINNATRRDIPAGEVVDLNSKDFIGSPAEPFGGIFAEMLVPYVQKVEDEAGDKRKKRFDALTGPDEARAGLPPPLLREGERVQPAWLYQFLRNPGKVRPQHKDGGFLVLRMPRFNMSDEEAMALVNYFAAADKLSNPGEALNYPYLTVPQRDKEFWRDQTQQYVARIGGTSKVKEQMKDLQPYWEKYVKDLKDRLADAEKKLEEARTTERTAQEAKDKIDKDPKADAKAKKAAEEALTQAKDYTKLWEGNVKTATTLLKENTVESLGRQWEETGVYGTSALKLLIKGPPCLSCHQAGNLGVPKGPPLDLAAERLRPDWTERWIAFPRRMNTYISPMPQNLPYNERNYQNIFQGNSLHQIQALRDILMNYPELTDRPTNRYYLMSPGGN